MLEKLGIDIHGPAGIHLRDTARENLRGFNDLGGKQPLGTLLRLAGTREYLQLAIARTQVVAAFLPLGELASQPLARG